MMPWATSNSSSATSTRDGVSGISNASTFEGLVELFVGGVILGPSFRSCDELTIKVKQVLAEQFECTSKTYQNQTNFTFDYPVN